MPTFALTNEILIVKISVITQDQDLCQILAAGNAPESFIAISDGVRLKYEHTLSISALSSSGYTAQLIIFVLEHCDTIATSLVASWLYERLKGRKAKLHIDNDDDIVISPEAIRRAIMNNKKEHATIRREIPDTNPVSQNAEITNRRNTNENDCTAVDEFIRNPNIP